MGKDDVFQKLNIYVFENTVNTCDNLVEVGLFDCLPLGVFKKDNCLEVNANDRMSFSKNYNFSGKYVQHAKMNSSESKFYFTLRPHEKLIYVNILNKPFSVRYYNSLLYISPISLTNIAD